MDRRHTWQLTLYTIGLIAIALFTIHALSSLIFSVLGLSPSSPKWHLVLILGSFLAVAGATVGLQSLDSPTPLLQRLTSIISGAASISILGFFTVGQLSGQQAQWAITGAVTGAILGGGLGLWTTHRQGFGRVAIALTSSLCAYGLAFSLGAWTLAAIHGQRWVLALGLGLFAGLYLWLTQRTLRWTYRQWQWAIKTLKKTVLNNRDKQQFQQHNTFGK
jgi:hypothetical protein